MFCKFCGKENADATKFCKHCGQNIGVAKPVKVSESEAVYVKEEENKSQIATNENNGGVNEPPTVQTNNGGVNEPPTVQTNNGGVNEPPTVKTNNGGVNEPPTLKTNNGGVNKPPIKKPQNGMGEGKSINGKDIKATLKKNKMIAIIIGAVLLIGVIFIGFKVFGNTIKKSTIEKDIVGQSILVGSSKIFIDESNLKNIKIADEREMNEAGLKFCAVNGTVSLENEMFTIEAPFNADYMYSNNGGFGEKGWYMTGIYIDIASSEASIEVKSKVTENEFKNSMIGNEVKDIKITENNMKDVQITDIETSDFGTRATANFNLVYDGKMLSKVISCTVTIVLDETKWELVNISDVMSLTTVKKDVGDISVEEFIKDFSNIASEGCINTTYKYMDVASFGVENIKEVKNIKVSEDVYWDSRRYIIDADISVSANKSQAKGPIRIGIVEDEVNGDFRLKANSFAVDQPTKDDCIAMLKDVIIEHKSGDDTLNYKLRDEDNNTLNITEVVQVLPNPREFAIYGDMTYNGLTNDKVVIFAWYDNSNNIFTIKEIRSFSIEGNSDYSGIKAVKERNKKYIEDNKGE